MRRLDLCLVALCLAGLSLQAPPSLAQDGGATTAEQRQALGKADQLSKQARTLLRAGRAADALAPARESVEVRERALGADHVGLAPALLDLAEIQATLEDVEGAVAACERANRLLHEAADEHAAVRLRGLEALTAILATAERFEESIPVADRRVELAADAGPVALMKALRDRGTCHWLRGSNDDSLADLERALAVIEAAEGKRSLRIPELLSLISQVHLSAGDAAAAREFTMRHETMVAELARSTDLPEDPELLATALKHRVYHLFRQQRFAEAEPLARRAVEVNEELHGRFHSDTAGAVFNLGAQLHQLGKTDEARKCYEETIRIYERVEGPDSPSLSSVLGNLGWLLTSLGELDAAAPVLERGVELVESQLGPEHPSLVMSLNNLASLRGDQGDAAEAIRLYERSLAIAEKTMGPGHQHTLVTAVNLMTFLTNAARFDDALPIARRAKEMAANILPPRHPWQVLVAIGVGRCEVECGDWVAAEETLQKGLELARSIHGVNHPQVGEVHFRLARLRVAEGRSELARPHLDRVLEIRRRQHRGAHPDQAEILDAIAELEGRAGRLEEALNLCRQALDIRMDVWGPGDPRVTASVMTVLTRMDTMNRTEEAREFLENAVDAATEHQGADHPETARIVACQAWFLTGLSQLEEAAALAAAAVAVLEGAGPEYEEPLWLALTARGNAYAKLDRADEELACFERALEIGKRIYAPDSASYAVTLNNYSLALGHNGRWKETIPFLTEAMEIQEAALGSEHPHLNSMRIGLGSAYRELGRLDEAIALFRRAAESKEAAFGPHHPDVAEAVGILGQTLAWNEPSEEGLELSLRALRIMEGSVRRNFVALQSTERLARVRTLQRHLAMYLGLSMGHPVTGYAEVLRVKGLVARAEAAERRFARSTAAGGSERAEDLRAAESRLSELATNPPPAFKKPERAAWREAYVAAVERRDELARAFARSFPSLEEDLARTEVTPEQIAAAIPSDGVLVDVLRTSIGYTIWVMRSDGEVGRLDLSPEESLDLDAGCAAFAERCATGDKADDPERERLGRFLREQLVERLRLGPGDKKWFLVPDSALAAVPFAALPGRKPGTYLLDEVELVQLGTAHDLLPRARSGTPRTKVFALGGVDYRSATDALPAGVSEDQTVTAALDRAPRGRRFAPLPETRTEIATLAHLVGEGCTTVIGSEATEAAVRASASTARILHLATHGFVRDDLMAGLKPRGVDDAAIALAAARTVATGHDPLVLCGLALAGANERDGAHGDDGILTALEASHLDLDGTELVTLSACETALGKATAGEGVLGLVRGFQTAGAQRVVASLWQVDDEATRVLMEAFYARVLRESDPLPPAQALREAALELRRTKGKDGRSFEAPRYWAAFVTYGR